MSTSVISKEKNIGEVLSTNESEATKTNLKETIKKLEAKFDLGDWNDIEKKIHGFEPVLRCLWELGKNAQVTAQTTHQLTVVGDSIYAEMRTKLINWKHGCLVVNKGDDKTNKAGKVSKDKKEIMKKSEQIIIENTKKKFTREIDDLLNIFDGRRLETQYGLFNTTILELKGITLMYIAWFVLNHMDNYNPKKKSKLAEVYELIIGIQKFITNSRSYLGKLLSNSSKLDKISELLLSDLNDWLRALIETYGFDGMKLYTIAPRLFVYTIYDACIPSKGITPRNNQIELNKIISSIFGDAKQTNNGFLISYKAMIGSGKTTSVVALCSLVRKLRELANAQQNKQMSKLQLIFCCNVISVKNQVAQIAYNGNIKFGVAYITKTDTVRIVNHNSCKNDEERELIICSPNVAEKLLEMDAIQQEEQKESDRQERYMLFLDEPTIGADQYDSDSLNKNISVMLKMPKWTILSSATLPDFDQLTELVAHHKNKYPEINMKVIYFNEIQIGCDVKTFENDIVVPHLGCKNKPQLSDAIDTIEKNPFLGRLYTHRMVRKLWQDLKDVCDNVPDISVLFSDINNLSADKVRQLGMELLRKMLTIDDSLIQKFCSSDILMELKNDIDQSIDEDEALEQKEEQKRKKDIEMDIVFREVEEEVDLSKVNFDLLGTKQAHQFPNTNLIVSADPIEFSMKNFANLLKDLESAGISGSKIVNKYQKDLEFYNKFVDSEKMRIEKATNKRSGKNEDKMMNDKNSQKMQEIQETCKPAIEFPEWAQINTKSHILKYAKDKTINQLRSCINLETLPITCNISDDMLLLLMAGVGIYSSTNTNDEYQRCVLELALAGQLAYLVADDTISYGTNYPINRVFIPDEFIENHSINTVFQLLGRAGRVGQSWTAQAFIGNNVAKSLILYVSNVNHESNLIESANIRKTIIRMTQEQQIDKMEIIQKESSIGPISIIVTAVQCGTPNKIDDIIEKYRKKEEISKQRQKQEQEEKQGREKEREKSEATNSRYVPPHMRNKIESRSSFGTSRNFNKETNPSNTPTNISENDWREVKSKPSRFSNSPYVKKN